MSDILYARDPNTGTMVPVLSSGMDKTAADARYAASSGTTLTGQVTVSAPTSAQHASTKAYADDLLPVGSILPWGATASPPTSWLLCNGAAYSRTTYAALFAVCGTQFNTGGEAATDFRVPNLVSRIPVGRDSALTDFNTVGKAAGAKTIDLAIGEIPNVTGQIKMHGGSGSLLTGGSGGFSLATVYSGQYWSHGSAVTGATSSSIANLNLGFGGTAHENRMPFIMFHHRIKAF